MIFVRTQFLTLGKYENKKAWECEYKPGGGLYTRIFIHPIPVKMKENYILVQSPCGALRCIPRRGLHIALARQSSV